MILPALVRWHRAPLRVDLAGYGLTLHTSGDDWVVARSGVRLGWNETWDFVAELLRLPSSHLVSAMNGDRYVPHPAERAAWATFEQWVNTQIRTPAWRRVARPWHGVKPTYMTADSPREMDERRERRARLATLF